MTPEKVVAELNAATRFPGVTNMWTMPIKTRIDMLAAGIKTPVGIKILGPDLNKIGAIGEQIEAAIESGENNVPGDVDISSAPRRGLFEMNSDIAVRKFTDRVPGKGRSEKIAAHSLESTSIPAIESDVGVELHAEAGHAHGS